MRFPLPRAGGADTISNVGQAPAVVKLWAAWVCWRHGGSGTLRAWVDRIAARRGKRIAVVALARRLSRILFALWRDDTTFDLKKLAMA